MTEVANLPQPDPYLTDRIDWSDNATLTHDLDSTGYGDNAYFYPPEILASKPEDVKHSTLNTIVRYSRDGGGSLPDDITTTLGKSPLWNDITGGISPTVPTETVRSDPHVQEFIKARRQKIIDKNVFVRDTYPKVMEIFEAGLREGHKLGYIPDEVDEDRIFDTLSGVGIQLVDAPIINEEHNKPVSGDYSGPLDLIRLNADNNPFELRDTAIHELRHRIGGGTFIGKTVFAGLSKDGDPEYFPVPVVLRHRTGFQQNGRHRGTDEALVEHSTQAILHGEWNILDPTRRTEMPSTYVVERVMLADFIEKSGGIIDLKTLMRANFEDTEPNGKFPERRLMMRQARQAYGQGAYHKLDRLMEYAQAKFPAAQGRKQLKEILDHIHPPVLDQFGNVTEVGWIDTNFDV